MPVSINKYNNHQLSQEKIITYFQPIISIQKSKIIGFEALSRGLNKDKLISPLQMLECANRHNFTVELDRLFRENAFKTIANNYLLNKSCLFFINVSVSILDQVIDSNNIINSVKYHKIKPETIVLEINEENIDKDDRLIRFVKKYKNYGFIIALDDVGKGFSNFNRIPLLMPDIIKIDISLVRDIHKDFYKQEVLKSITELAHKVGALVIAEGVEKKEELTFILKENVDLIQGYYFSHPEGSLNTIEFQAIKHIKKATTIYKKYLEKKINCQELRQKQQLSTVNNIIDEIQKPDIFSYEIILDKIINNYVNIEAVFILNEKGIQISDTILNKEISYKRNQIFHPAEKNTNHSLKKYIYILQNSTENCLISEPYISLATGNQCITITKYFINNKGEHHILCVDFTTET